MTTLYDFEAQQIDGKTVPLAQYKGHPLLIVNTASACGFTPQFAGLQALWTAYRERGLVVLGFPSNEFGHQDPGSNEEIAGFCEAVAADVAPFGIEVSAVPAQQASALLKAPSGSDRDELLQEA